MNALRGTRSGPASVPTDHGVRLSATARWERTGRLRGPERPGAVFGPETVVEHIGDDAPAPLAAARDIATVDKEPYCARIRWWAKRINRLDVVPSNGEFGIANCEYVTPASDAMGRDHGIDGDSPRKLPHPTLRPPGGARRRGGP